MVELQPVDAVEVTLVVDNFVDILLAGAEGVRRFPLAYDAFDGSQLVAEPAGRRPGADLRPGPPGHRVRDRLPIHNARAGEGWEPDPLILDDQNLIVDVAGKGPVVVSGCSHAGAVNVLRNAQRLTGRCRIVGFVGGFHLTGAVFEPLIEPTIAAVTDLGIERLVPGHCTGWKATHRPAKPSPTRSSSPRSAPSCGSDPVRSRPPGPGRPGPGPGRRRCRR
jgi:hypothetical protein